MWRKGAHVSVEGRCWVSVEGRCWVSVEGRCWVSVPVVGLFPTNSPIFKMTVMICIDSEMVDSAMVVEE